MANGEPFESSVKERRIRRGWSQDELARRSGLSRAGISAIETQRLIPSTAAALALAEAFGCRVEDLFHLRRAQAPSPTCAWPVPRDPWRVWEVEIGGQRRLYPTEPTALGVIPHDGVIRAGVFERRIDPGFPPARTLMMACCDPAVGLLAAELERGHGVRLIPLPRPSRRALRLLAEGLVHLAGVHLNRAEEPEGNASVVSAELGPGYGLVRAARWEEGIAVAPGLRLPTVRQVLRSTELRWIGREQGSGARQCLDELLGDRLAPVHLASDHRSVAEAIRQGWGDAGVCLRLVSEEAGLDFLGVREEAYDLCIPASLQSDERIEAVYSVLRSRSYRQAIAQLPGYQADDSGDAQN